MLHPHTKRWLAHYAGEPAGVLTNLARLLEHGTLAGSGKLTVLPVDQGVEHGPTRSFAKEPGGMDPLWHAQLAIDAGCSAHAAPLGALERVAAHEPGAVPLILKLNGAELLSARDDAASAPMATVQDALRLGCTAVGLTLYPGSRSTLEGYAYARDVIRTAREVGLPTVLWAYPRGAGLSKAGETAIDVVAYAAHLGCQLGAHVIKVKPPTAHVEQPENAKALAAAGVSVASLSERVAWIKRCAFAGTRLVLFSGGAARGRDEVLSEVRALMAGGADGCIVGRNSFQRPPAEGRALLADIMQACRQAAG
jgi:class I fructose-bisphosphate aldolase